jgi:hypothetical protein
LSKQTSFPQRRFDGPSTSNTKDDAVYGATASPFLFSPNTRLIDTQYGIGKDGDNLKIGISNVLVDSFSNISIVGKLFEGTEDLWKILTRINVDYNSTDKKDLHKYMTILEIQTPIWRVTMRAVTYRPLEDLNLETLLRNYFHKPKEHCGNSG